LLPVARIAVLRLVRKKRNRTTPTVRRSETRTRRRRCRCRSRPAGDVDRISEETLPKSSAQGDRFLREEGNVAASHDAGNREARS
jgi:hypothetical protein